MLHFTLENGTVLEFPVSFGPLNITIRSGIDWAHVSRIPGGFGIEISNVLPDALDYCDYDPAEDADSEIGGYYPDQSAAPGSSRYGKTAPRKVEFVASYYLATCNADLPTV